MKPVYYQPETREVCVRGNGVEEVYGAHDPRHTLAFHVANYCRALDYEAAFCRRVRDFDASTRDDRLLALAKLRDLADRAHRYSLYIR